jgi:histidine triad (HIT) family protein
VKQVENFPDEQKQSMLTQINEMTDDQLEEFVTKNKLVDSKDGNQSPFRMIVENKIPSFKIAENDKAIAILEINPITKGHTIIIPKIPYKASEIPEEIQRFAQLIASHLTKILSPKDIQIAISEMFEEAIINVLPIYKDETFESPRSKADDKNLANLQTQLILPPPGESTLPLIKEDSTLEEQPQEPEEEEQKEPPKKKRKTPITRLPKAPKRQP